MTNKLLNLVFGGALSIACLSAGCADENSDFADTTESALRGGNKAATDGGSDDPCATRGKKVKRPKGSKADGGVKGGKADDADESLDSDEDADESVDGDDADDGAGKPEKADKADGGRGKPEKADKVEKKGGKKCLESDGGTDAVKERGKGSSNGQGSSNGKGSKDADAGV
jgi:hypothetical protein